MRLEKLSVENNQILIGAQTAYSSDYGKTFYKLNAPVGAWYNGVVIGGNIILCGDSVFLSKDNGTTFTKPLNHSGWFNIRKSEQKVFVWDYGTNLSFVSIDSGKTWQPFSNGTQKLNEIFDTKGDTVVVLKLNKIEYSTDFGLTWHSNPAPGFAIYPHATLFFKGDTLILATNDSVFYSLNLGINWIPVTGNPDLFPNNINELKGKLLISSLQLGVLELDIDNKSLTDRSNGIHGTQFDAIATNGDTIVAVAKKVLLYYSHDNGHSWHSYHLPNSVGKLFACGQEFYFTQGNWIYKSNDGAVSFNYFTKNKGSGVINDMTFNDSVLYCATNYGIYSVSRTSGFSKKLNSTFSTQVTLFDTLLFVSDGKKIFEMRINDSLLIEVSPPVNMSHAEWNSLTSNDAAIFISSFDKGVYRNYPPDTNWIYTGLYNMGANKIICDKKGNAYCISHKGVMVLLNKPQAKWDPVNHGFPRPLSVYKGDLSINTSSIIFAGSEFPLTDRKSTRLNSSHVSESRMPSSA